jgi:hypothetical protein
MRRGSLLDRVAGSERGSVALGVAVVALTARAHYHSTSTGKFSVTGLIFAVVMIAILYAVNRFRRRNRGN